MPNWTMTPLLSIANDTLNGVVNWRKLHDELDAIVLGFSFVGHTSRDDSLSLVFTGQLTAPDDASVRAAVAAHDGVSPAASGTILETADDQRVELTGFAAGAPTWRVVT